MKISVIIPIYNEERVIGECLASLGKQTHKDMEIIVVDDGSTDQTLSLVAQYLEKYRGVKLLKQDHKGPGPARNLGAKHTTGKILIFVDSDMTFAPDFIEKLIQPIKEGKTKGTFSKEEYVSNPENAWSRCWGINESWEEGKRHPKNYPHKQKVFRAILKSELERIGGFSSTGYTDDWTLSEKLGYEAEAATGAVFYHKNPDTLKEVFAQARWIGKRQYKLGRVGTVIAMVRSSLPVSLIVSVVKALGSKLPQFIVFKVVYDFGIFSGAFLSLVGGNNAK